MTRGRKSTVKSKVIVPLNESKSKVIVPLNESNDSEGHSTINTGEIAQNRRMEKRSRSEGDETRNRNFEFKLQEDLFSSEKRSKQKPDKADELHENEDLRVKLRKLKEQRKSRSRSRSRQRSRSPRNKGDSPTQTDKRSLSGSKYGTETEDDDGELSDDKSRKKSKRSKFSTERTIETVTTPVNYDIFKGMPDESDDDGLFNNFKDTEEGSEVIFNKNAGNYRLERRSRDKNRRQDKGKYRKRRRGRSRSKTRSTEKRRRLKDEYTSDDDRDSSTTTDSSDDDSNDNSPKKSKSMSRKKRNKLKRHRVSSASESESEAEMIHKLVSKFVKKKDRKSGGRPSKKHKADDKVSRIVQQVVEQINASKEQGKQSVSDIMPQLNTELAKETEINKGNSPGKVRLPNPEYKSPSEPTLYVPAVPKGIDRNTQNPRFYYHDASPQLVARSMGTGSEQRGKGGDSGVELIDQFIKSIRLDHEDKGPSTSAETQLQQDRIAYAKDISDRAIIEAEKNKAKIQLPEGRSDDNLDVRTLNDVQKLKELLQTVIADNNDDDFFHIICHIEPQLLARIRKGDFVELEKLLQKPEHLNGDIEGRQVLVHRDGEQFYVPYKGRDSQKITGIKKWDQAFRVYAAIYCQTNPNRATEILQYADIINQAASKFSWEKVAKYDYVFRHLMAKKPNRSWAKTYTQMWTLELSGSDSSNKQNFQHRRGGSNSGSSGSGATGKWKDNCCWKYNKGDNCSYGKNCRFEHRCTFCGSYSHPSMHCPKKEGHPGRKSKNHETDSTTPKHDNKKYKKSHSGSSNNN